MRDVDLEENVFIILDTKFHKTVWCPFSTTVAEALKEYLERFRKSPQTHSFFQAQVLTAKAEGTGIVDSCSISPDSQNSEIPYNGSGNGPRPHDIRHTFAVHCLNNWVLSGEDITAALPVLSRYLGHNGLSERKVSAANCTDVSRYCYKSELQFGALIPQMEVANENI